MEVRELPPPPWPLPAKAQPPAETRWWHKDVPTRTVRRFVLLSFLVLLGGCVAMCQAERARGEAGRRRAVAALDQITIPGAGTRGATASMGCNDYQFPMAARTDATRLAPSEVRSSIAERLDRLGWVSNAGKPGAWTDFTRGSLELNLDVARSGTGSTATLVVQDSDVVC